jgi:hypothetical protein
LPAFNDIYILWYATDAKFFAGYELLRDRYYDICFFQQSNFERDTLSLLTDWSEKYVCFFVDDNIIYRPCSLNNDHVRQLFQDFDLTCFSLRLGANTILQDPYTKQPVQFPPTMFRYSELYEPILLWEWKNCNQYGNFGYAFSVDGHIYKTDDILNLINYDFDTPNALEGRFNTSLFTSQIMMCFEKSVLVNNPINLVGSSNNNAGRFYGHSLEELNEKFLDNYQISLNSIVCHEIVGCHQEMEIDFEKV